jgi:tetratricopeptide (TPR) repeat protein
VACKTPKRVLLVGWDAADWQMIRPLMEAGEMPNMKRFVDEGVSGNVATLQPALSPMLWTSIVTGKTADKHGVLGFAEADGTTGRVRPVTSTGRTCKAIWNILSDHGRPSGVINWYASHPAEQIDGFVVTDRFAHPTGVLKLDEALLGWETVPRSVWPAEDLEPLAGTRVHPQMISHEQILAFVPGATDPDSASWEKIRELRSLLAHCATVHNSATAYIAEREWDFLGIYYDAIDRFAHAFMEHHPPQMEHVSDRDFGLYQGVMNECYRFHDLMLGRLMKLIDEDTAVVILSDHGFHSGVTRPAGTSGIKDGQPAAWHRPYGVISFWGPGIKKGEELFGATLLDVMPTILTMLGMKPARDMDGLPLNQIWSEPRLGVERVDTYETDSEGAETESDPSEADVDEQILHQLRQLGYLGSDQAEDIMVDRARNLATVYMSTGRPGEALIQFRKVQELDPSAKGINLSICACLLALGRLDEAKDLAIQDSPTARHLVLLAMISSRNGDHDGALEHLLAAKKLDPSLLGIDTQIGRGYIKLGQWENAECAFELAIERDPDDAEALDGFGLVYQRTGRMHEAVLAHTQSIAFIRNRSETHAHLGEALVSIGRIRWAIEAFAEAARISPWDPTPHARLVDLYERVVENPNKAAFHRKRAADIRQARQRQSAEQPESQVAESGVARVSNSNSKTVEVPKPTSVGGAITLVSGLPRSGTSLMMQMLEAGGLPALTDEQRQPDENNPRGYHELEAVKHTATDASWLASAPGCVTKVIHAILRALPLEHEYTLIFMKRRLEEVVASQGAMLDQMGVKGSTLDAQTLKTAYTREYERIGDWLSTQPNFRVLEVSFNELMNDPKPVIERIRTYLGVDLDTRKMLSVVDPALYRQQSCE